MQPAWGRRRGCSKPVGPYLVHRFDTEHHDLQQRGLVLELHERHGRLVVVLARSTDDGADGNDHVNVQVDRSWAIEIFAGLMSPLTPLERRLAKPWPGLFEAARTIIGDRNLLRVDSRIRDPDADAEHSYEECRRAATIAQQAV
jgi:hypothetical protein